jgi:hypothetical protein
MPFNKSEPQQVDQAKRSALSGLLRIKGVEGVIISVHYLETLKAYKVGVQNQSGITYHTIAVSEVAQVTRPRLGVQTSQRN